MEVGNIYIAFSLNYYSLLAGRRDIIISLYFAYQLLTTLLVDSNPGFTNCQYKTTFRWLNKIATHIYGMRPIGTCVGFVAAAVSMPMGGCRAIRPVVGVDVAAELAVL